LCQYCTVIGIDGSATAVDTTTRRRVKHDAAVGERGAVCSDCDATGSVSLHTASLRTVHLHSRERHKVAGTRQGGCSVSNTVGW
jgi:hypothetical protein